MVTCKTEPESSSYEWIDDVEIVRLPLLTHPGNTLPIPRPSILLKEVMKDETLDVVITQSRIFPTTALGTLFAKVHKIPLVHVERGSQHTVLRNKVVSKLTNFYDHTIGEWVMSNADRTVGISQAASDFISHLQKKTSPVVIYNGMNQMPDNRDAKKAIGDNQTTRIVFTGRLIHAKGVQDLIEAFSRVANKRSLLQLVIVGDGGHKEILANQACRSSHSNQIIFTGGVDHDKITDILSTCDIFVNPSYSEGLPTSVAEAAGLGMPIIATDVGGTNELIFDKGTGLLVKPHDVSGLTGALEWVLDHKEEAKQMGQKAKERVQMFNWETITDQWEVLLDDVVSSYKNKEK